MNTYHNYRILTVNGWILSELDNPPTFEQLKAQAQRMRDPVMLLAEDETGTTTELGWAGYQSTSYDYLTHTQETDR